MTRYLALLFSISLLAQFGDPRWQVRRVGPAANRPAQCIANRDVFVCSGSGCSPNPSLEFCTAANTYTAFSGGVTSVDAGNGVETVSGSAITGTGTIRGAIVINAQTGTTYTILTTDRGKLITHSNGSSIASTLPQAGVSFPAGWFTYVQNLGAGTVTITPTTSTIDGAASLALATNQGTIIVSNGTNYFTMRGFGSATGLADPGSNGMLSRTSSGTTTARTITGTSNEVSVSDGDGVGGNPIVSLPSTVNLSGKTVRIPNSTTLPATCTVGDQYMDTDATSGQRFYLCESTNTWQAQGGAATGLGDPGSNGMVYRNGSGTSTTATATEMAGPLYCADAGSNDTYACSLSPTPSMYTTGATYIFKANTANTGAATINFNSLGAKTIKKAAGGVTTDLADNDIRAGQIVELVYDGTNMQMQSTLGNAASGSSGALVLIEQHTASSSASLDFTSCISSTYDNYLITIQGLAPATTSTAMWLRVSTDGGSSYISTSSYRWTAFRWSHAGTAVTGSTSDTKIVLTAGETQSNDSNYGLTGAIRLFDPGSTSVYKRFNLGDASMLSTAPEQVSANVGGTYMSTSAINAFQFRPESGNISSGTVRCYGITK